MLKNGKIHLLEFLLDTGHHSGRVGQATPPPILCSSSHPSNENKISSKGLWKRLQVQWHLSKVGKNHIKRKIPSWRNKWISFMVPRSLPGHFPGSILHNLSLLGQGEDSPSVGGLRKNPRCSGNCPKLAKIALMKKNRHFSNTGLPNQPLFPGKYG